MLDYRRGVLTEGAFSWPGRCGMMLTDGWFWARRAGGYNVYAGCRTGVSGIDFDNPIAACGPDDRQLTLPELFDADNDYWLAVKAVSGFGLESEQYSWLRIRTDSQANGQPVPAQVEKLTAGLGWGGRIILKWEYQTRLGWLTPSKFKVYVAIGDDEVNWSSPVAQIEFRSTQKSYVWDSLTLGGSGSYKLAVRAETAAGVDDGSVRYIVARADSVVPGSVEEYQLEQVDD